MSIYIYKARDASGKKVTGSMEAATKTELIDKLQKMGYLTTAVEEETAGLHIGSFLERFKWISTENMLMFYIQLANMINAGVVILMSLTTLSKQTENKILRDAIGSVTRQVEAGNSLSQAFAARPDIFNRLFINMVRAGEASGHIDTVLMRYAGFFERQEDLNQKVKGALFYPVILLIAGIAVMLFIITFVIPQFAQIYLKAGVKLPGPTVIVYNLGMIFKHFWYVLFLAAAGILTAVNLYARTEKGRLSLDSLKLKLPVIGPLYRKVAIARFARTLSTLLGSGVPILESLDVTKEVAGNEVLRRVIINAQKYVEKGERMSEPLKVSGEFPPDVVQMVLVGEETGNVDGMLAKIADFYDTAVNYTIKKLTTVIEPFFLIVMGCMIGFIMASMLMPIFDMLKTMKH